MNWQTATLPEVLEAYSQGHPVWTIEMGGLGPGYEQCIQLLTFELLRDNIVNPPKAGDPTDNQAGDPMALWGEATVTRLAALGLTGAQVCAAKNLASRILTHGYQEALAEVHKHNADRLIMFSSKFPQLPVPETAPQTEGGEV